MFFLLLCLLLWGLFANKVPFDQFGWLMLVATAWFTGFLDCRFFGKLEADKSRGIPPDHGSDRGSDATLFES